ncbi:PAS domain S-box protein, partial [Candidatus Fermentibacterales bacterium]|nr:PAS domain S-box protein [Candidatus Fermentibacterales bacterium]
MLTPFSGSRRKSKKNRGKTDENPEELSPAGSDASVVPQQDQPAPPTEPAIPPDSREDSAQAAGEPLCVQASRGVVAPTPEDIRKVRMALLESDERLGAIIFTLSGSALFLCDSQDQILFSWISPDLRAELGLQPRAGESTLEGVLSADADRIRRAAIDRTRETGKPQWCEIPVDLGKRGTRWLDLHVTPVERPDGSACLIATCFRDVTERHELRQQAEGNLSKLEATLECTTDGFLVLGPDGGVEDFNTRFLEMWKLRESQVRGRNNVKVLEDVLAGIRNPDGYLRDTMKCIDHPDEPRVDLVELKDGRVFERHSHPRVLDGAFAGRVISFRDTTESRKLNDELSRSREMLQLVMDCIPEGIFWKDTESRFLGCNRKFMELNRIGSAGDMMGRRGSELGWDEQKVVLLEKLDREVIESGEPQPPVAVRETDTEGRDVWLEVAKLPIRDHSGKVVGVIGTMQDVSAMKRDEEALRESEEKYRTLVERASDGITIIQDRVVVYVNPRLAEMSGCSVEEIVGCDFSKFIHPDNSENLDRIYRARMDGGEAPPVYEAVLIDTNGDRVFVEINAGIISYRGRPADMVIVRDVSERRKVQESLRESEEFSRTVIENSPVGISVRDGTGRLLLVNDAWKKIWAMTEEDVRAELEAEGTILRDSPSDTYLGDHLKRVQNVYRAGGDYYVPEIEIPSPRSGAAKWIAHHFYAIQDDDGNVVRVVILTEDITNRKDTLQALSESETKYRTLTDNIPVGLFRTTADRRGRMLSSNVAMATMFGYDLDEMEAVSVATLYDDYDDRTRLLEVLAREGRIENYEVLFKRKDGSHFWGSVSAHAVRDEKGSIQFIDGTISDITERRSASDGLRESLERLQNTIEGTVSAMAAMVEMKDPYTAGHQKRVADLACAIAREMELDEDTIVGIRLAGVIHDLGKICVPAEILSKPGTITDIEMNMIKTHPQA